MEKQITKYRPASIIETSNLAIDNRAFGAEVLCDPRRKLSEAAKRVPISRDEFILSRVDVRQRSEAINL